MKNVLNLNLTGRNTRTFTNAISQNANISNGEKHYTTNIKYQQLLL